MSEGCCDTITLFKGEDGRTIWNGPGTPTLYGPTSTDVQEGDFYIDTDTWEIYGPYSVSGWGTGTSLIGPQGDQGPQGDPGAQGNGIVSTLWTSNSAGNPGPGAAGTVDTYTITYDDATTDTFTVTNGNATVYDLNSVQNGADADIRLVPGLGTTDIVKLEAGTNVTLTDTGSNIRIDAAGGTGGLTWIKTSPPDTGGANYNALPNHGYVSVNIGGGLAYSEFLLPLGTVIGDVVKIVCEQGKATVRPTSPQIVLYGTGVLGAGGFFPTVNEKFYMGVGESIELLYMGDDNWIIDNFQTSEPNPDLINPPRIQ